jgi:hypothetical protein
VSATTLPVGRGDTSSPAAAVRIGMDFPLDPVRASLALSERKKANFKTRVQALVSGLYGSGSRGVDQCP